jgi:hypothetical protein
MNGDPAAIVLLFQLDFKAHGARPIYSQCKLPQYDILAKRPTRDKPDRTRGAMDPRDEPEDDT